MSLIALLLLSDSRLPSGTHEHSGGLEAAVAAGRVRDAASLHEFLLGRLSGVGLTGAAFTAAAVLASRAPGAPTPGGDQHADRTGAPDLAALAVLDAEYDARTPSPVQRRLSRTLGGQLVRAVRAGWPDLVFDALSGLHAHGPHRPVVFGAAACVLGIDALSAATAAALGSVTGPAETATRLLRLSPDAVTAALAALEPAVRETAAAAVAAAQGPPEDLPAFRAPLLDISAEHHNTLKARFYAS